MAKLDLNVIDKKSEADNFQIIEFRGEMDKSNNADVREALERFIDSYQNQYLIFDLKYFDFINSEGVGLMVAMFYKLKKMNKDLMIVSPQPSVFDVFNIIGLPKIVPTFDSLDEALVKVK